VSVSCPVSSFGRPLVGPVAVRSWWRVVRWSVLMLGCSLIRLRRSLVGPQSAVGADRRSVSIVASPLPPRRSFIALSSLAVRPSPLPALSSMSAFPISSMSVTCRYRLFVCCPSVRSSVDVLLGAVPPPLVSTLFVPRSVCFYFRRLESLIFHHSSRAGQGSLYHHESDSPLFRCPLDSPLRRVRHSAPPRLIRHATIY
jgi:hypothetical protein